MASIEITLTIVFIVLKLSDVVDWSWWLVFLPVIIIEGLALFTAILNN